METGFTKANSLNLPKINVRMLGMFSEQTVISAHQNSGMLSIPFLCTAPNKYTVVDPEGSIRPRCCIDIVVRHNAVYPGNCNVTDKFRVEMQNHATKQVIGKQVVTATLLPGKPAGTVPEPDVFQNLPQHVDAAGAASSVQHQFGLARDYRQNRLQAPNHVAILTAVVCIGALLLPTQGEPDSRFPSYLHLTPHLKLVFAYVLGMVTMVILKPL